MKTELSLVSFNQALLIVVRN